MEKGTGLMHVKRDGTPSYYCSRKCKKNAIKLKRKPRLTKWVYKPAKK
jgi:ribosomal protein L24E